MNIGTLTRAKALMTVERGSDPNGAMNRETVAPVANGVVIKSGQLMSLSFNVDGDGLEKWILGWDPVAQPNAVPFFSKYDSDDTMVSSSGLLSGLSCADNYELTTAYYTPDASLLHGVYLVSDTGTPGNVKWIGNAPAAGTMVLGKVAKYNGAHDIAPVNSGVTRDGNGQVLVLRLQTQFQLNAIKA